MDIYKEHLLNRGFSRNTIEAYLNDLEKFNEYLSDKNVDRAEKQDILKYIIYLKDKGYSESSIMRKLSSLKYYFYYALNTGRIEKDPTFDFVAPKLTRKVDKEIVDEEILLSFLSLPSEEKKDFKSKRDTLILYMIYYTGVNILDLIDLKKDIVDFQLESLYLKGEHIFLKSEYIDFLSDYIGLLEDKFPENEYLLVNLNGKKITRQGVWKILKKYSDILDMDINISPQTLINNGLYYRRKR